MKVQRLYKHLEELINEGKGNYDIMIALDDKDYKNSCDLINDIQDEPINNNIGRVFLFSVNSIGWK